MKKYRLLAILLAAVSFVGTAGVAHANPSYVAQTVQTSAATTSPVFISSGLSTTTLTYDSYLPAAQSQKYKSSIVSLAIQFAASSSASILNETTEYSNDGIDWYRNFVVDSNALSTTTAQMNIGTPSSLSWKFASSTTGGILPTNANSATSTALVILSSPTRFLRIVLSMTGGNGAIWAQLIPIKEQL